MANSDGGHVMNDEDVQLLAESITENLFWSPNIDLPRRLGDPIWDDIGMVAANTARMFLASKRSDAQ